MDTTLMRLSKYLTFSNSAQPTHAPQPRPSLSHVILQAVLEETYTAFFQLWETFLQVKSSWNQKLNRFFSSLTHWDPSSFKSRVWNQPTYFQKPSVSSTAHSRSVQFSCASSVYILFMTQTKDQKRAKFVPTTHPNPLQMNPRCLHKRTVLSSP